MKTFLFIHGFSRHRLDNLRRSYRIEGIAPRSHAVTITYLLTYLHVLTYYVHQSMLIVGHAHINYCIISLNRTHGNKGRLPVNTFTPEEEIHIVAFIQNYAETHAILLPGRIPGYKRIDLQLLPSSTTKHAIYLEYAEAPHRRAAESTFNAIWHRYLPHVVITKAASDLCWQCQQNSTALVRSQSSPLALQSEVKLINYNNNNNSGYRYRF